MMIVKIGGGREINVPGVAADLARTGRPCVVVHGANFFRDSLAEALGRKQTVVTSVSGYPSVLSDEAAIELLMMAYAGLRNKQIVQALQQAGIDAVGLSGLDGRVIQGRRNPGIRCRDGDRVKIVRDLSGKPRAVNVALLTMLLENRYTPVLTVPIVDEDRCAINSENDDIVAVLQEALAADLVVQLIEAPGLLIDSRDPSTLIPSLTPGEVAQRERIADGRIKRKLHALSKLFTTGRPTVYVCDGRTEHPLLDALSGRGTVIRHS